MLIEYECNNGHITIDEEEIRYGRCVKCGKKLFANVDIKKCPCCNGVADVLLKKRNGFTFVIIKCSKCGIQTSEQTSVEDAIAIWDRRE